MTSEKTHRKFTHLSEKDLSYRNIMSFYIIICIKLTSGSSFSYFFLDPNYLKFKVSQFAIDHISVVRCFSSSSRFPIPPNYFSSGHLEVLLFLKLEDRNKKKLEMLENYGTVKILNSDIYLGFGSLHS